MEVKQIALGSQGLVVPMIGLGCMGMTGFEEAHTYGPADEQEAMATIQRSLELGGNFSMQRHIESIPITNTGTSCGSEAIAEKVLRNKMLQFAFISREAKPLDRIIFLIVNL